jgi:hypothetical protein
LNYMQVMKVMQDPEVSWFDRKGDDSLCFIC